MSKEHFLFLKSDDSITLFPDNSADRFSIQLTEPIILEGSGWRCALREFKSIVTTLRNLYVFCDIVEPSNVCDLKLPILRRIAPQETGRLIYTFDSTFAFPVTRSIISTLRLTIIEGDYTQTPLFDHRTSRQAEALFDPEPTTCVLHLFKQ